MINQNSYNFVDNLYLFSLYLNENLVDGLIFASSETYLITLIHRLKHV